MSVEVSIWKASFPMYHFLSSSKTLPKYLNFRTCFILTSSNRISHTGLYLLTATIRSVLLQLMYSSSFLLSFTAFSRCFYSLCVCYQCCVKGLYILYLDVVLQNDDKNGVQEKLKKRDFFSFFLIKYVFIFYLLFFG